MAKFTCNFISYTLKRTVDITVVIPTVTIPESMGLSESRKHTPKEKFPVLYLFHGMGNNHATWTGYTNVEMYAEERQIAVVNISAENKSYVKVGGVRFLYLYFRWNCRILSVECFRFQTGRSIIILRGCLWEGTVRWYMP